MLSSLRQCCSTLSQWNPVRIESSSSDFLKIPCFPAPCPVPSPAAWQACAFFSSAAAVCFPLSIRKIEKLVSRGLCASCISNPLTEAGISCLSSKAFFLEKGALKVCRICSVNEVGKKLKPSDHANVLIEKALTSVSGSESVIDQISDFMQVLKW